MSYISSTVVGDTVIVWERNEHGDRVVRHFDAPFYFYYDDPNGQYRTMYNTPVSKYEAETASDLNKARQYYRTRNIRVWEGDIAPDIRVLSREYYNKPAPAPHVTFLDIENNYDEAIGYASIQNPYAEVNAIALFHNWRRELVTIVVPPDPSWTLERLKKEVAVVAPHAPLDPSLKSRFIVCETEEELLVHFLREIQDSDILSGWNSELFDIPYLCQRIARVLDGVDLNARVLPAETTDRGKIRIPFEENPNPLIAKRCKFLRKMDLPKHGRLTYRTVAGEKGQLIGIAVDMVGRVHLDYMNLVKKYEPGERQSYKLATVSEQVLVDEETGDPLLPKLKYEGSLARLYRDNFPMFVRYNMRDSEILWGFEQKLGYVELANQMAHISTSLFTDVTGTIKLADRALVNYLHHVKNRVAPTVTEPLIDRQIEGALVLYPQVGLHHKIGSIDINSLYPSVIRLINISPEMLRGQFERCAADMLEILAESGKLLNLVLEDGGETITLTAAEWKHELLRRKWAVSGYGTVFDQSEEGFIPAILSEWYAERKRYQALKKEAETNAADCTDPAARTKYVDQISYYDRLQYVYKIKLNSLYGALSNLYFRFFDLRMGESTTGTGRMVLRHQCRQVSFELGHGYDVDFPMYYDVDSAMEKGYSREEAEQISLNGSKFKGSHQTNAVVYGDTDSTYFNTYATSNEEAIRIADDVAAKVNASFPAFTRKTFLVQPTFDKMIKAGREVVSDRGIFVEKKRYILHLIDLDGKPVDKMKVMGLDTKKTTIPADVGEALTRFIERFLKGEEWNDISLDIVKYKQGISGESDLSKIGLPKGIKGIEAYTSAFTRDAKTRLPGHVSAAILYNQCLEQYADKASPIIVSGMKIRVYYLKRPIGRFTSIALPSDLEAVPPWFHENFAVDMDAHLKRLVDNPLSNILKAIGKVAPSPQSLFDESIFVF